MKKTVKKDFPKSSSKAIKRSKLEDQLTAVINDAGEDADSMYEVAKAKYTTPAKDHTYLLDFLLPNGIALEAKGYLDSKETCDKYVYVRDQNPGMDLRFVFSEPNKLVGRSKVMTNAKWAEKNNFKWCSIKDTAQIIAWLKEKRHDTE